MKQLLLFLFFWLPFSVYPQLNESFDHAGLTDRYPWVGTVHQFTINQQGELQLSALAGSGSSHLALASTRLYDNEWRCKVKSDYWCTAQNYFTLYLWCRKPALDDPGEAVFVRLGYTKKNIALCYQYGNGKPEILLEGRALFTEPATVEVKVVTDGEGQCTLYAKGPADTGYVPEGTLSLPCADASGWFMLGAVYSGAHSTDKYWDDIHIRRFTSGTDPLRITRLEQVDERTLHLWTDRPVQAEEASFTLPGLGEVAEIAITDDGLVLELSWGAPLVKGQTYRLAYTGLLDGNGHRHSGEYPFTATFGDHQEDPPAPVIPVTGEADEGAVVINEVMADPKGLVALPETEYVEIANTTSHAIPLDGWHFRYDDAAVPLPACSLPPEGYAVLYRTGRPLRIDPGGMELPLDKFPSQLANSGKALSLTDATGKVIDHIAYEKAQPGISWERTGTGWQLSSDNRGGTPGSANSFPATDPEPQPDPVPSLSPVLPEEIVINELLPEPFTGGAEYIELYNRSGKTLPLDGLSLATRSSDGGLSTRYPLQAVQKGLDPGAHIVLTRSGDGVVAFYPAADPARICEVKIPLLANTASDLVLFRTGDGAVIDEVAYSYHWHASSVKDRKGVALERIDPDKPGSEAANWTSATAASGYGTPGDRNSHYKAAPTDRATGMEAPVYDRATGLYHIIYSFDQPGFTIRARIYDLSGRQVAVAANHEAVAMQGAITWNGTGTDGSRLAPGVYIFHVEATHPGGEVRKGKSVFLVYGDY